MPLDETKLGDTHTRWWTGNTEAGDVAQPHAYMAAECATEFCGDSPVATFHSRLPRYTRVLLAAAFSAMAFGALVGCGGGSSQGAATQDEPDTVQRPGVMPPQCSQPKACA